jgi:NAD(P)-dependent dehydrogenase (short-subunit alcohol dehydrogenase family)
VVLLARSASNYEPIVKEINDAGGKAIGISTDISSPTSVKDAFAKIGEEFKGKKLAAAIFNVGGTFIRKPFLEMSLEEYEVGFAANGYVPFQFFLRLIDLSIYIMRMLILYSPTEKAFTSSPKPRFLSFLNPSLPHHTHPP